MAPLLAYRLRQSMPQAPHSVPTINSQQADTSTPTDVPWDDYVNLDPDDYVFTPESLGIAGPELPLTLAAATAPPPTPRPAAATLPHTDTSIMLPSSSPALSSLEPAFWSSDTDDSLWQPPPRGIDTSIPSPPSSFSTASPSRWPNSSQGSFSSPLAPARGVDTSTSLPTPPSSSLPSSISPESSWLDGSVQGSYFPDNPLFPSLQQPSYPVVDSSTAAAAPAAFPFPSDPPFGTRVPLSFFAALPGFDAIAAAAASVARPASASTRRGHGRSFTRGRGGRGSSGRGSVPAPRRARAPAPVPGRGRGRPPRDESNHTGGMSDILMTTSHTYNPGQKQTYIETNGRKDFRGRETKTYKK